jgi:UDPglucose--hexose-1-phosphate uridylyltransferase
MFDKMNGIGAHEVIIETPNANLQLEQQPVEAIGRVLETYKIRMTDLLHDPRFRYILIFKNFGRQAGATIGHPHSQLIATPVIPSQVRHRLHEALRHYDDAGECMFCHMVESEMQDQTRIVIQSERFVAMEVFASATPFATHIFPLRHMASFGDISEMEISDLARILRTLLAKIYLGLENPDLNFTVRSGPAEYAGARHFHWYVSVIPRLTRTAGFELGSGMFINTVLPEAAAEFLRKVAVDQVAVAGAGK